MWMKEKISVIVAIISLTVLELYALSCGIDGQLFSLVVAMIGGLAGYSMTEIKKDKVKI